MRYTVVDPVSLCHEALKRDQLTEVRLWSLLPELFYYQRVL